MKIINNFLDALSGVLLKSVIGFDGGDFSKIGVTEDVGGNVEGRGLGGDGADTANVLTTISLDNDPITFDNEEAALEGAEFVFEHDDDE